MRSLLLLLITLMPCLGVEYRFDPNVGAIFISITHHVDDETRHSYDLYLNHHIDRYTVIQVNLKTSTIAEKNIQKATAMKTYQQVVDFINTLKLTGSFPTTAQGSGYYSLSLRYAGFSLSLKLPAKLEGFDSSSVHALFESVAALHARKP